MGSSFLENTRLISTRTASRVRALGSHIKTVRLIYIEGNWVKFRQEGCSVWGAETKNMFCRSRETTFCWQLEGGHWQGQFTCTFRKRLTSVSPARRMYTNRNIAFMAQAYIRGTAARKMLVSSRNGRILYFVIFV